MAPAMPTLVVIELRLAQNLLTPLSHTPITQSGHYYRPVTYPTMIEWYHSPFGSLIQSGYVCGAA